MDTLEITCIGAPDDLVSAQEYRNTVTLRVEQYFPDHEPREEDPHYSIFRATRRRMKEEGRLCCYICGAEDASSSPIELHHQFVEWSLQNGVDLERFFLFHYPDAREHTQEELAQWVNGESNLLPLCSFHHRGAGGIHCLPYPQWIIQRYWRSDLPPAARRITALGEVVFLKDKGDVDSPDSTA